MTEKQEELYRDPYCKGCSCPVDKLRGTAIFVSESNIEIVGWYHESCLVKALSPDKPLKADNEHSTAISRSIHCNGEERQCEIPTCRNRAEVGGLCLICEEEGMTATADAVEGTND